MNRVNTSPPSILLPSTGVIGAASSAPTFHMPAVQLLIAKDLSVPAFRELPDGDDETTTAYVGGDTEEQYEIQGCPQPISQCKLDDLVLDLSLSKISAELLPSRHKEKNLL